MKFDILYEEIMTNHYQSQIEQLFLEEFEQIDEISFTKTTLDNVERGLNWLTKKLTKKKAPRKPNMQLATNKLKSWGLIDLKHWLEKVPLDKMADKGLFQKVDDLRLKVLNADNNTEVTKYVDEIYKIFKPYFPPNPIDDGGTTIPAEYTLNAEKEQEVDKVEDEIGQKVNVQAPPKIKGSFKKAYKFLFNKSRIKGRNDLIARVMTALVLISGQVDFN